MAIGMIIGSVFWLTSRIDRLEQENAEKLVELMVTERVNNLEKTVGDYAYWDTAYELITTQNESEVDAEIGTAAISGGIFSHILIVAPDETGLFLYGESGRLDSFDLTTMRPFLDRLRQTQPKDRVTISGIGALDGGYGAVSAAFVTPTYLADLDGRPLPILIGVKMFTDDALQAIIKLTHGTGFAVNPFKTASLGPVVPLIGPDGAPVAELAWTPSRIGSILRAEIMPGILIVCAGIFGICVSAARYFYSQSNALELAVSVATTDRLTGLLNRSGLDELLRRSAIETKLTVGKMGILYIDLNDFKRLNDIYGHKAGDQALKLIARRLKDSIRSNDHVVRLGGDEFIVVILDDEPETAARTVSERLLMACSAPMKFGDIDLSLTPAMGISVAEPGATWDSLLSQADAAMFYAKRRNQRTAAVFLPSMALEGPKKLAMGGGRH